MSKDPGYSDSKKDMLESRNRFLEACLRTAESRVESILLVNDGLHLAIVNLKEENEKLKREIEVLRLYGNKDCTAMADEVLDNE